MIYALLFALFLPAPAVAEEEVWRSIGFGNLYRINGMRLSAFEITSTTCVHSFDALRTRRPVPGAERSFRRPDGGILAVSAGGTAGQVSIYSPGALYKVRLERIANMPSNCNPPATNTPQTVFEIFASTFTEHYISFERRRVDWKKSIEEYRARVNRQSTPQQTFDALESMRASLYDLHTGIEAPSLKRESAASFRSGSERVIGASVEYFAKEGRNALFSITDKGYLGSKLRSYCRGQLQYLLLESGAGYLRILSFGGYARRGKDRSALDEAFDEMFANPKLRALVIDLRLSFGGEDQLALAMAARLSRYRYLAFTIEPHVPVGVARPADPVYVEPSSRSVFSGPVILLTSPVTMSAAEVLVLALRGRTPKVHVIGEATQGVFCDPLERHLPNGWTFALPNTVYRSPKGETFDVDGIPPDIAVPAFAKEDVAAGRDAAMSRALKLLTENQ